MSSSRRIYKATYEPRLLGPQTERAMALEKASMLRALQVQPSEAETLRRKARRLPEADARRAPLLSLTEVATQLGAGQSADSTLSTLRTLATVDQGTVSELGKMVVDVRSEVAGEVGGLWTAMRQQHMRTAATPTVEPPEPTPDEVINWSANNDPGRHGRLSLLAERFARGSIADLLRNAQEAARKSQGLVDAFLERTRVSPVGWLHLERLRMTPAQIERGELLHSLTLAPGETINLSHREWSIRNEELERIVVDANEGYSEEGVAEKHDASLATSSQSKHATAFNFGASYGGFGVNVSTAFSDQRDETKSRKESVEHSMEMTRKASSRSRREHKVSFRVSTTTGQEQLETRVIHNPSDSEAMRIDHHRMIRTWVVEQYRFGLRMTYDLVVPSPGSDLARRAMELRAVENELARPFAFADEVATVTRDDWQQLAARYGAWQLSPPPAATKIGRTVVHRVGVNARVVNVEVEELTVPEGYEVEQAFLHLFLKGDSDSGEVARFAVVMEGAPVELSMEEDHLEGRAGQDRERDFDITPVFAGSSGELALMYAHLGLSTFVFELRLHYRLKPEAYERWQADTLAELYRAAQTQHDQRRDSLQQRRQGLQEALAELDALTLRRMEREEIVKAVLRWIFGPQFELVPSAVQQVLRSSAQGQRITEEEWLRIIRYGEWVKFLHHAVEWENVLVFLYPYFWDRPELWDDKLAIDHPDPRHREFLRAGSARVVLTIRPGFENTFARVVELGSFDEVPGGDHPYVSIVDEMERYVAEHYDDPTAAPDDEPGVLIGTWQESMPCSGLDVEVSMVPVLRPG